ncbi:MAG: hypothetical protein E6R13_07615 [Spirochaetes bacterium]|nr:MAG: hypothetical protein E6R13_07615 [Spirochaetota bacterium]
MIERKVIPSIPVYITNPEDISGGGGGGTGVNAYSLQTMIFRAYAFSTGVSAGDYVALIQLFDNTISPPILLSTQYYNMNTSAYIASMDIANFSYCQELDPTQYDGLAGLVSDIANSISSMSSDITNISTDSTITNTKLDTVSTKLDTINTSIGTGNTKTDTTNTKLDTLGTKVDTSNIHLEDIAIETNATAVKLDTVNTQLTAIDTKLGGTIATSTSPSASEVHLGEVGGMTIVRQVVLSLDTGVGYASGEVLADTQIVSNAFRKTDGTGVLQSIVLIDKDDQGQALDIVILDSSASLGTENSAVSISDSGAETILGIISVVASDWLDLGGVRVANIKNIGLPINAALFTDSLYVGAICRGTPTHTANGITLRLGILLD